MEVDDGMHISTEKRLELDIGATIMALYDYGGRLSRFLQFEIVLT
jgi:hypothetical protein